MIPIRCKKCGHVQDAGSALSPNDTCERCGTAIYGPKARNPKSTAVLAVATLIGAALLGMPDAFLLILGIVTAILIISAGVQRTR